MLDVRETPLTFATVARMVHLYPLHCSSKLRSFLSLSKCSAVPVSPEHPQSHTPCTPEKMKCIAELSAGIIVSRV